jgi:hypothetical protein
MEQPWRIRRFATKAILDDLRHLLGYVGGSRKKYRKFIIVGILRGYDTPWEAVKGQAVLGEEDFVERTKARMNKRESRREQPGVKQLEVINLGTILRAVSRYFNLLETEIPASAPGIVMNVVWRSN